MAQCELQCPICLQDFLANHEGRRCCSRACASLLKGSFEERFWARVQKSEDCWEWQGRADEGGYARIRRENSRERVLVHRLSWEFENGPIPEGLLVLHKCDNRICVRTLHLFLGTHQINTDDMFEKGRANKARGERHGNARLSDAVVAEAKRAYAAKEATQVELARQLGVHPVYLNKVMCGHKRAG